MAQSANQELVQNLKPFIAQTVANMGLSELHYDNAIANPDKPLKSSSGGLLTLVQLNSSSISNGASNDILMRAFGEVTIESGNSTDDDLILKTGGAGNVLVQGASSNVITSPDAGIADLRVQSGLGNLTLDAPIGSTIRMNRDVLMLQTPGKITGLGTMIIEGSAEVHLIGQVFVSDDTQNLISTPVGSIPDLYISADTGDVIIDAPGDIILQPGGSVVFSGGNLDVDDTLHFPNLVGSYITAASILSITPTGNLWIAAGEDLFIDNDIDFIITNPAISTTTQLTLNSNESNIRLLADTDIDLNASSGDVFVRTSSLKVSSGVVAGNLATAGAIGQFRSIKAYQSGTVAVAMGDTNYSAGLTYGMTYADSYGEIITASGAQGGLNIRGMSVANHAMWLTGNVNTESTTRHGTGARAPLIFRGFNKNSALGSYTSNVACFFNGTSSVLAISGNGTLYSEGHFISYWGGFAGGASTLSPARGQMILYETAIQSSIQLQSSTVSHTMTFYKDTSSSFLGVKRWSDAGGCIFRGYTESVIGISIEGFSDSYNGSTGTTSTAAIMLRAYKATGSGGQAATFAAGENLMVLRNAYNTDFIWKAGGSAFANIIWNTWDEEDDISVVRAYGRLASNAITNKWDEFVTHNEDDLGEMGLVVNGMTNMTGMMQLHNGALWQLNTRISELENLSILGMIKLILNKWLRRFA